MKPIGLRPRLASSAATRPLASILFSILAMLAPMPGNADTLAETINVAVASNFATTMKLVKQRFEQGSEHRINLISGSSGKQFAQIINGAPFDLYLSADVQRPRQLLARGLGTESEYCVYALGQLALWSRQENQQINSNNLSNNKDLGRLAIANPEIAPYGMAAVQVINTLGLMPELAPKLVRGENVSQAFQFAYSGNAELGFIALSQALAHAASNSKPGSYWQVPRQHYQPIEQAAVLLSDTVAARNLFSFLCSDAMQPILRDSGYLSPDSTQLRPR